MHVPGLDPGIDSVHRTHVLEIIGEGAAWMPWLGPRIESGEGMTVAEAPI
jgi:hypothetical protein